MDVSQLVADYECDRAIEQDHEAQLLQDPKFSFLNLPRGTASADDSVIVGDDHILFINSGSNHWASQLQGEDLISKSDFIIVRNVLGEFRKQAANRSIALRYLVCPEKDLVYSAESPSMDARLEDFRTVNVYRSAFPGTLVYPLEELRAASSLIRTYHKRDSHYNFFGGLIVVNSLLYSLGRAPIDPAAVPVTYRQFQDDLTPKWEAIDTIRRCVVSPAREISHVMPERSYGMHLEFSNPEAADQDAIMLFGDSYSWNHDAGIARFLSTRYATVHFFWKKQIDWDLVDRVKPSAIVLQSAERFLLKGVI